MSFRRFLYRAGVKKINYFPVPIIIVGNITVGGTGKTPLVIWLANFLKSKGYRPGIVSRGYRGQASSYPRFVTSVCDSFEVGDEPLIIARRTECPVVIDPNRPRAVQTLLTETDCNIILSDDGLQHYALDRDIEIAMIDGQRGFGNGFCLPVGPLREPVSRLKKTDFIVINGINKERHSSQGWLASRPMDLNNKGQYSMELIPTDFVSIKNIKQIVSAQHFQNKKIHAVAGIGNPARFFNLLRSMNLTFTEHVFPDHHHYKQSDLSFDLDSLILMTEKDAVKCEKFADERYWYLSVTAELPAALGEKLLTAVKHSVGE